MLLMLTACATSVKPGLTNSTKKLDLGDDCLLLLTAELSNDYQPSYQPEAMMLQIETLNPKDSKDRMNVMTDEEGTFVSEKMNKYVFRARLKSGKYVLRGIAGGSGIFPIRGTFFVPLHCEVEAKKGEVVDLGKVVARTRERQNGEFRAGPLLPLVDQAVTGYSVSTFDVKTLVSEKSDVNALKVEFPVLRTVQLVEEPLPPFDRDTAQKWWDTH